MVTLNDLITSGRPSLLVFMDPECAPCGELLPDIARWQQDHGNIVSIVPISRGTVEANPSKITEHEIAPVLLQRDDEVANAYQVYGTPSAVLVQADGTIGSLVAAGRDAIRALVGHAVGKPEVLPWAPLLPAQMANGQVHDLQHNHHAPSAIITIGEPAPPLRFPDLEGQTVDLAHFRGSTVLVLFWNPHCGFCQEMLPELKAWEATFFKGQPKLLVVSTGTVEENRAMGLQSSSTETSVPGGTSALTGR
jgi:thiol-disulfide isomerase/thioredoxin